MNHLANINSILNTIYVSWYIILVALVSLFNDSSLPLIIINTLIIILFIPTLYKYHIKKTIDPMGRKLQ